MSASNCSPATLSHLPNEIWKNTFGYLTVVLSIISTFENIIVFVILLSNNVLQTPSNKIFAALAGSDFLTGLILAPIHAVQLLDDDVMQVCSVEYVRRYLSAILIGASALTLGIISYDRYLHLVHLQNYRMTKFKLYILLFVSWLIPCLMPLLRLIDDNEITYSYMVSFSALAVFTIIVISYAKLMVALKRHGSHSDNELYRTYMKSQKRAGRTVLIIITFYIIMFLPTTVTFVLYATATVSSVVHSKIYVVGVFLLLANSAVNPVIYTYRTPELQKFTRQLFGLRSKTERRRRETTMFQMHFSNDAAIIGCCHDITYKGRVAAITNTVLHCNNAKGRPSCVGIAYRGVVT